MPTFKKILVPTDLSERAASAYTHAREIARRFDAVVDFIHIIPTMKYFSESLSKLGVPLNMEKDLYPHAQKEAKEKLETYMAEYFTESQRGEAVVLTGRKPAEAIVSQATSGGYDLIVMAARGEHETDFMRGGVTEKVIRQSEIPVFTVDKELTAEKLNQILVPTDMSALSFTSFPLAVSLANLYGAELTLLHVIELHSSGMERDTWDPAKSEEENLFDDIMARLQEYIARNELGTLTVTAGEQAFEAKVSLTEGDERKTIPLHVIIKRGVTPHAVIEDYATYNADLVVMTTHGHTGLARFLLGSTTEKVVQYVDLPVLTVKPKKEELKATAAEA